MANWLPMFALPHVAAYEPIETDGIALVTLEDPRLKAMAKEHSSFAKYLNKFWDEFSSQLAPSIIIWRNDLPDTSKTIEAIAGFRDAIAISVIPYAWARTHRYKRGQGIRYADWFSIYPWMIDKNYEHLIAQTGAVLAIHEVSKLHAQSSPCISHEIIDERDIDRPLIHALFQNWISCFCSKRPPHQAITLFRSLNMAHAAAALPAQAGMTTYDTGRSISLYGPAPLKFSPHLEIMHIAKYWRC